MCIFREKSELREERDVLREQGEPASQEEERCRVMRRRARRGIGRKEGSATNAAPKRSFGSESGKEKKEEKCRKNGLIKVIYKSRFSVLTFIWFKNTINL